MDYCYNLLGVNPNSTLEELDEALASKILRVPDSEKNVIYTAYQYILQARQKSKIKIMQGKFYIESVGIKGIIVRKYMNVKLCKLNMSGNIKYVYTPETVLEMEYTNNITYNLNNQNPYEVAIFINKYNNQLSLLKSKISMLQNESDVRAFGGFKRLKLLSLRYCCRFIEYKIQLIDTTKKKLNEEVKDNFDLSNYRKLTMYKESLEYQKNTELWKPKLQRKNTFVRKEVI